MGHTPATALQRLPQPARQADQARRPRIKCPGQAAVLCEMARGQEQSMPTVVKYRMPSAAAREPQLLDDRGVCRPLCIARQWQKLSAQYVGTTSQRFT